MGSTVSAYFRLRYSIHLPVTLALGAASWLQGNLLWLGRAPPSLVVALWGNFLVPTLPANGWSCRAFCRRRRARQVFVLVVLRLLLRLAGDGLGDARLLALGGVANALALLLFILSTVSSVIRGARG